MTWALVLPIVTLASVTLSVVVGIVGLRQGHYHKGKITKRGMRAVAAMIALGVVTLVSVFAGQRISEAREREEAEHRTRQFNSQMATSLAMQQTLRDSIHRQAGLTNDLRAVQRTLGESLRRQEHLADATAANLRMGRLLQTQARRNAGVLMNGLVEQTNRVVVARISFEGNVVCRYSDPGNPGGSPARSRFEPVIEFVGIDVLGRDRIHLNSRNVVQGHSSFSVVDFRGDIGLFDTLGPWREASLFISVHGTLMKDSEVEPIWPVYAELSDEELREFASQTQSTRETCRITGALIVNRRLVARVTGLLSRRGISYSASFRDVRLEDFVPRLNPFVERFGD